MAFRSAKMRLLVAFRSAKVRSRRGARGHVLPAANRVKSARGFSEQVVESVGTAPLRSYRMWKWRASYVYYTGRPIPVLDSSAELLEDWQQPTPVFVIVERGMRDELLQVLGPVEPLIEQAVGSNHVYLFGNLRP